MLHLKLHEESGTDKHKRLVEFLHNEEMVFEQVQKTDPALLAKILLRRTAVKRDKGGLITLNENDVIEWFENGDHLREFHETDLM